MNALSWIKISIPKGGWNPPCQISNFDENTFRRESCKKKNKRKERKELRDRPVELKDTEMPSKLSNQKSAFEKTIPFEETNPNTACLKPKTHRNSKSKRSKYILAKHSSVTANQPFSENRQIKFREQSLKLKPGSRNNDLLNVLPKIEENNTPVVVLHHRGKKPFKKSKEHLPVLNNRHFNNDHMQILKKNKIKNPHDSTGRTYVTKEDMCENTNLNVKKHFKEKGQPRPTNRYFYETPNFISEKKIELNKHKCSIGKGVSVNNNPSSPHDSVINQLNSAPVPIVDKPLSFMRLFRIASVFQGYKDKKKYDEVIKLYCEKTKEGDEYHTNTISKPSSKKSLRRMAGTESTHKLYTHEKKAVKRIKGLRSKKSLRRHKNTSLILSGSNQCSLVAVGNTFDDCVQPKFTGDPNYVKHKKVLKKRKINHLPFERSSTKSNKKIHVKSFLSKEKINLVQAYQNSEGDVYLRNMSCGDGAVRGEASQSSSQNKKLSTIYSESVTTSELAEKESTDVDVIKNDVSRGVNEISLSKAGKHLKNSQYLNCESEQNTTGTNKLGKISIVKPNLSEDGKQITFQVVKSNFSSRNIDKLNKHLSKLNNRHLVKASKENVSMTNDRLMLFYANQEASCTSQDSLNIAISKDTELSNDGGSNSVLKVVIKQTNSLSSNSKTATLTDLEVDNDNCKVSNMVKQNALHLVHENEDVSKNCKGFEGSIFLDNTESENTTTITDSQEPDSKRSVVSGNENEQRKSLFTNKADIFTLQNSSDGVEQQLEKVSYSLKQSPKTAGVPKVPSSGYFQEYKSVTIPLKKSYIKCAQKNKDSRNSPNRKQFSTCSSPRTRIEKLDTEGVITGKTEAQVTRLAEIKNKRRVSPRNQMNDNRVCDNYQQSLEDLEHIQLKLRQIGLTHKKSFVKVIDEEHAETSSVMRHKDINSVENSRLCQLKTKLMNIPFIHQHNKKQNNIPLSPRAQNYSLEDFGNYCRSGTKNNGLNTMRSLNVGLKNELLKNLCTVENKQSDNFCKDTKNSLTDEHSQDGLGEKEELKTRRENFVKILPKTTDLETPGSPKNVTETPLHEQASEPIDAVPLFTESGVQTDDLNDQFRETLEHSFTNPNDHLNSSKKCREPSVITNHSNCNKLFNIFTNKTLVSFPENKNSFVNIEQNRITPRPTNEDVIVGSKETCLYPLKKTPGNILNESNKIVNTLVRDKYNSDGQIVGKINAIYDFLQYLDTVLKSTAVTKQNDPCGSPCNNIGHFNKTLRCLCTNCIEILKKFDVKQTMAQKSNENSNIDNSQEREFSQYVRKRSLFVSEVSPTLEVGCKSNEAPNAKYVNITKVETPFECGYDVHRHVFQQPLEKCNRNPFIVVVSSNESLDKTSVNQSTFHVKNQLREYLDIVKKKEHKRLTTSNYSESKIGDEVGSRLMKKKIYNCLRDKNEFNISKDFDDKRKPVLNNHKKKVESASNYVKNDKSPESKMVTNKTSICKSNLSKVGDIELPKRSTISAKPVLSDLYLEKPSVKTVKPYLPNNQPRKHSSTIYKSEGFGDSESCYVESAEDTFQNSIHEKSFISRENRNVANRINTCYNDMIGRQANQNICHINTGSNKTTRHVLPNDISKSKNTFSSSAQNRKITKDDSACPNIVKKMCSTGKRVFKTLERNIVGSVSRNRLAQNNDINKSNSSLFQRLRNNTSKLAVKKQTNHNRVQEEKKQDEETIRCDSDESINSFAYSECLHNIKDRTVKDRQATEESIASGIIKNKLCQNNNAGQDLGAKSQTINRSTCENHEDYGGLKNVHSSFSVDSSFSQNKQTLVFTNKHLSSSAELHECVEPLCHCFEEKQRISKKETGVINESSICDSTGWISISSCDLLNKNREENLKNSESSSDLEKVRVQMDINLNDVMHVEFFCQPSDSVAMVKNKNSFK